MRKKIPLFFWLTIAALGTRASAGLDLDGGEQKAPTTQTGVVAPPAATPEDAGKGLYGATGSLGGGSTAAKAATAAAGGAGPSQAPDATGPAPAAIPQGSAAAQNPDDKNVQALAEQAQARQKSEASIGQRAQELLANLRGDAGGAPPPGAAILASPLPAGALTGAAPSAVGTSPTALLAASLAGREPGLSRADALVREAQLKIGLRDFAAADGLLSRRLEQAPADEPALRLRGIVRRFQKRLDASEQDARAALALSSGDSRARALLVDDLVDLGRSRGALREADAGLAANPRDARVLAARADVWASLGDDARRLADLREAAGLDAQFDALYRQALAGDAPRAARGPGSFVLWLGAIGTALLFFSFALFRRRGNSSVRLAMRAEDHAALARGGRPDSAPRGFRIERRLGEGGMGVVYEAVDLALQRPVALKKLRAEIADNPRERARFLKEARTVASLRHPNIVAIHSISEDEEGLFLVFEKIAGETLHERLGRGPLSPADAAGVLKQIAAALDHAHAQGIVHQDLKPANVMIEGGVAKVMDFGIARRVAETLSTLSKIAVAGTPAYMAPEQEKGGAVGPAADVFALGACAYELLSGRMPFPSGGLALKTQKMFRPLSEARPDLPRAVDAAVARALEPEPGARWPSARSFVDALARALAVPA